MIDFFTPPATDDSLAYLGSIFGNVNGVLPSGGDLTLLSVLFGKFNAIILVVGAAIVVYTTVVGVMMTAHEGEFMKKWNSLWTPLRSVLGIAMLFPTATGYSAIQMIIMWVIVQGIGAADTLWTTALQYTTAAGSPFAQVSVPTAGNSSQMTSLFTALTCDESARFNQPNPNGSSMTYGNYYCNAMTTGGQMPPWCTSPGTFDPTNVNINSFSFGPNGSCGSITYCNQATSCTDPTSLTCQACQAQATALSTVIPALRAVANTLVQVDYDYQNFFANGYTNTSTPSNSPARPDWITQYCTDNNIDDNWCRGPAPLDLGFLTLFIKIPIPGSLPYPAAGASGPPTDLVTQVYWPYGLKSKIGANAFTTIQNEYQAAMQKVADAYIQGLQAQISSTTLTGQFADSAAKGWIQAGAYYYTLASSNKANLQGSFPTWTVNSIDPSTASSATNNPLMNYRTNCSAAAAVKQSIAAMSGLPGASGVAMGSTTFDTTFISDASQGINSSMTTAMGQQSGGTNTGGGPQITQAGSNPLINLAMAGYILLEVASVVFVVFLGVSIALGLLSGANAFALGTGAFNFMAVSSPIFFMIATPLVLMGLGFMVTMGATLGVYLPLVPYIIFTIGAIGWLTTVIEAMVAGPLVALGILAPGGQHEILGHGHPALMLLFTTFLRPSLMIFGLVAALLLSSVVVQMVNEVFWSVVVVQIVGTATNSNATISGGPTFNAQASGVGKSTTAAMAGNPLMMVLFLVAYVTLLISVLNKSFAAIHIIPERVMSWIGGQGAQYGESDAVGAVKGAVDSAGQRAAGGMTSTLGKSKGTAKDAKYNKLNADAKKKEAEDAALKKSGGGGGGGEDAS